MPSDIELLRRFSRDGSEEAFSQLVSQRMALVYSVALRQTNGDSHLAQDVAQKVFADLARKAAPLSRLDTLAGWLCKAAQYAAIDHVRAEARRRQREAQISGASESEPSGDDAWTPLRPTLDRLIGELSQGDRDALVSRFYDEKSFTEIAETFRITEDGARKRVFRGLEKLRTKLEKIGIVSATSALSEVLPAQALSAVPAGLSGSVAQAAVAAAQAQVGSLALTSLLMSKTTTVGVIVLLAAACSVGYVDHVRREAKIAELERTVTVLEKQLSRRGAELSTRSRSTAAESSPVPTTVTPTELNAASAIERLNRLKDRLKRHPEQDIPENRFLTDGEWLQVAIEADPLESDSDFDKALAHARTLAEGHVQPLILKALQAYIASSGGQLPADAQQLAPYFDPPLDTAILSRYEMLATGVAAKSTTQAWLIGLKPSAVVEDPGDTEPFVNLNGYGSATSGPDDPLSLQTSREAAKQAYYGANGQLPADEHQLLPFFRDPAGAAAYESFLNQRR